MNMTNLYTYIYIYGGCSVSPLYLSTFMWIFNPLKFGETDRAVNRYQKSSRSGTSATKMRGYDWSCACSFQKLNMEDPKSIKIIGASVLDVLLTDLDIHRVSWKMHSIHGLSDLADLLSLQGSFPAITNSCCELPCRTSLTMCFGQASKPVVARGKKMNRYKI